MLPRHRNQQQSLDRGFHDTPMIMAGAEAVSDWVLRPASCRHRMLPVNNHDTAMADKREGTKLLAPCNMQLTRPIPIPSIFQPLET
jgi:hypothetical protein